MFTETIKPRFCETDAIGHISNTTFPEWLEGARAPVFELFSPEDDMKKWPLILARMELDFLSQGHYKHEVEIKTYISRLGGSSFDVTQEVWQQGKKLVEGKAIMVYFCYQTQKSKPIEGELRETLLEHCHPPT